MCVHTLIEIRLNSESLVRQNFCKDMVNLFVCQEKFFGQFNFLSVDAAFKSNFFFLSDGKSAMRRTLNRVESLAM